MYNSSFFKMLRVSIKVNGSEEILFIYIVIILTLTVFDYILFINIYFSTIYDYKHWCVV